MEIQSKNILSTFIDFTVQLYLRRATAAKFQPDLLPVELVGCPMGRWAVRQLKIVIATRGELEGTRYAERRSTELRGKGADQHTARYSILALPRPDGLSLSHSLSFSLLQTPGVARRGYPKCRSPEYTKNESGPELGYRGSLFCTALGTLSRRRAAQWGFRIPL